MPTESVRHRFPEIAAEGGRLRLEKPFGGERGGGLAGPAGGTLCSGSDAESWAEWTGGGVCVCLCLHAGGGVMGCELSGVCASLCERQRDSVGAAASGPRVRLEAQASVWAHPLAPPGLRVSSSAWGFGSAQTGAASKHLFPPPTPARQQMLLGLSLAAQPMSGLY